MSKLIKVYFDSLDAALAEEQKYTDMFKDGWNDGVTTRWCEPMQDDDENGEPYGDYFIMIPT